MSTCIIELTNQSFFKLISLNLLDDNATNIVLSTSTLCPKDDLRLKCTARNTSIIRWSSNIKSNFALCQISDPSVRNITIDGIRVVVKTYYSDGTFLLACNLEIKAAELPVIRQLSFTCQNVDIGIGVSASLEVLGKEAPT